MQKNYRSINIYERTVHTMFFTLCILSLTYCVILISLVFSVIEEKQNTLASKDLVSKLNTLEVNYSNKISSINDQVLSSHNFVRIDGTTFVVRKDPIASYTVLYAR